MDTYDANWLGLIEAAIGAEALEYEFLWLDPLCINQKSNRDKKAQIQNMARWYRESRCVLIMIGGCAAVQSLQDASDWINRAWTLQEATLAENAILLVDSSFFRWPDEASGKGIVAARMKNNTPFFSTCTG